MDGRGIALRLITRVKVLKNIVKALISTLPRHSAIFVLISLIFYIFAVMFTSLFKGIGDRTLDKYFGKLGLSLYTLFEFMTLY